MLTGSNNPKTDWHEVLRGALRCAYFESAFETISNLSHVYPLTREIIKKERKTDRQKEKHEKSERYVHDNKKGRERETEGENKQSNIAE